MSKFHKNKALVWIICLLVLVIVGLLFKQSNTPAKEVPKEEEKEGMPPISISIKEIKEENFSGKIPVISGVSELAVVARAHVEQKIAEFKTQADTDVPAMREKYGVDSPIATYTIDIEAKYLEGEKTETIILSEYSYTGGANGNSLYKVINASKTNGKVLSLSDVVRQNQQNAFTLFVKKQLNDWRPEGSADSVVFSDVVGDLTFASFTNWSLNTGNLNLYFSKYEIGPGVLGAVVFPLPKEQIKNFLELIAL